MGWMIKASVLYEVFSSAGLGDETINYVNFIHLYRKDIVPGGAFAPNGYEQAVKQAQTLEYSHVKIPTPSRDD